MWVILGGTFIGVKIPFLRGGRGQVAGNYEMKHGSSFADKSLNPKPFVACLAILCSVGLSFLVQLGRGASSNVV